MYNLRIAVLIYSLSVGSIVLADFAAFEKSVTENHLIPDVFDVMPMEELKIDYGNGVIAELCHLITPTQGKSPPSLEWSTEPDALYTVVMIGVDGPIATAPWREFVFWLVLNVPATDVAKGEEWVAYVGPMPAPVSGTLRYVMLVMKQNDGKLTLKQPKVSETDLMQRKFFRSSRFAKEHGLSWPPVAANCFTAKWDEQVDVLYRQLGATIW